VPVEEEPAYRRPGLGEACKAGPEGGEAVGDRLADAVCRDVVAESLSSGGEAGRHGHASRAELADHLAE